jgi:hypothetical protein
VRAAAVSVRFAARGLPGGAQLREPAEHLAQRLVEGGEAAEALLYGHEEQVRVRLERAPRLALIMMIIIRGVSEAQQRVIDGRRRLVPAG